MKKKGELLIENIVFIILNLVFLSILVVFLISQGSGTVLMEDAYSKQIALLVDSAKPGMVIKLNMEKGFEAAKKNGVDFADSVTIDGNVVSVRFSKDSGKSYSFFNDVSAEVYPDVEGSGHNGIYVLTVSKGSIEGRESSEGDLDE